jgi:outer membrane protein TolC
MAEGPQAESPTLTSTNAKTELVATLGQIVEIRERQAVASEMLAEAGQATIVDVANAKSEVWRARVSLARSRGESDAVLTGLRRIVGIRENAWRQAKIDAEKGMISAKHVGTARLQILEARVDLCMAIIEKR